MIDIFTSEHCEHMHGENILPCSILFQFYFFFISPCIFSVLQCNVHYVIIGLYVSSKSYNLRQVNKLCFLSQVVNKFEASCRQLVVTVEEIFKMPMKRKFVKYFLGCIAKIT